MSESTFPLRQEPSSALKHEAVRQSLRALALETLSPGDVIPGERALESRYGVSRITIRRAVADLCAEGILVRVHGKGTYVSHGQIQSSLHLASFTEDMRASGIIPSTEVLLAEATPPPPEVADFLRRPSDEPGHHVRRLRLGNGVPVSIDDCWFPAGLTKGILETDLTASLYRWLSLHEVPVITAQQSVAAESAGSDRCEALAISSSDPVLVFERISFTRVEDELIPIEFCISTYRADRYRLTMSLDQKPALS